MKIIKTKITINATPAEVWDVLMNFTAYPQWNPFIIYITGNIEVNNRLKIKVKPVDSSTMTFKPIILTFIENKEITWEGNLFVKGLFDGKHTLKLIANNDNTTTFIQSESFKGLFVPFFTKMIEIKTLKGFHLMNESLKRTIENL